MPQRRPGPGRSWGTRFDSLTSSDSLSSNPESVAPSSRRASSPPQSISADEGNSVQDSHDRILHDASIFIGSLPSNIDHAELTGMLSQHLSQHPQVKSIKVVRDSRGGACAFIQCQNPEAASLLMHNLHVAAPQPFLGRYLRYEPARAFRTLLISYRSPRQYSRQRDASRKAGFVSSEEPCFIELQLPNAMRITRVPGNRQLTILFNSNALETPPNAGGDPGLLLAPLLYDAESLLRIASVFGTVDYFGPYVHVNEYGQASTNFSPPHDAPRSPVMDPGCWKVKWAHRDDCISALVTLRRIPHLTITWAHQSNVTPREHGFYNNSRQLTAVHASQSWRSRAAGPALRSASNFLPASHTFPAFRSIEEPSITGHPSDVKVADSTSGCNAWKQGMSVVQNSGNVHPSWPSRPRALSLTHDRPQPTVSPPSRESTGQLSFTDWESANRTRWADHVEPIESNGGPSVARPNPACLSYLNASSGSGCQISQEGDSQEIASGIPHTPDFGTSPITPRIPGPFMVRTPTTVSHTGNFQSALRDYDSQSSLPQLSQDKRGEPVVDPTTIFVGGLEMFGPNAWDEAKVRMLFSKYGGIEAVKVIRPSNKRSAFAFVKFNNTEAPARAVKAEHNRMLDGRLIRVQLRDWYPTYRPSWRPGPSKEPDPHSLGASDDLSLDPKLSKPGITNIATHMADLRLTDSSAHPTLSPFGDTCDLNEVQDEDNIPIAEVPHDPGCDSAKEGREAEKSLDVKQVEPLVSQTPTVPAQALQGVYPPPAIQYYQGWIPNYTPQFPYQMPLASHPYTGFSLPPPIVPPPHSGSPDSGGVPPYPPIPLGPVGGAYSTFMPYPPPLSQGSDAGQATVVHQGVNNNPTLLHTQAPLIPTGFIQGDQGMLVPVYPPDALNQYMAGNQDQSQAVTHSGSAEGQPPVTWRSYPPPPIRPQAVIFHPYISPPLTGPPPHALGAHAWMPGHTWHGVLPQPGNGHGMPGRRISPSSVGGPGSTPVGSSFERHSVPPRRQYRRDYSQHHKNSSTRGMAGRFGKPSFEVPRSPPDVQSVPGPQITTPAVSADASWQRWNTDQANTA